MSKKLSLDALAVESFETAGVEAFAARPRPSRNYSECETCGIACTYDCEPVSANYTDCGSCGIACTSIEC